MPQQVKAVIARSEGRSGRAGHDQRPRPRAGRGRRAGAGVRGVPHRPALPRGRDQRRLPVPARARGGRRGRVGRRGRHRGRARRLRDPQLARGVRRLPRLQARRALVLLRHPQRRAEDDPRGRHRALARRWASARSPRRRWSPPASAPRSTRRASRRRRAARLRRDGRPRRGDQHRQRRPWRVGRGHRLRRRRRGRGRRARPWPARGTIIAVDVDPRKLETATRLGATHTVNGKDEDAVEAIQRSPAATAPTSSSTRSAGPRPGSRRSTPATSPAPWCWSACPPPT